MDRYSKTGVLAAGLISGLSIYIIIPHFCKSVRRFSKWMTGKPVQHFRNTSEDFSVFNSHPKEQNCSSHRSEEMATLSSCHEDQHSDSSDQETRVTFTIENYENSDTDQDQSQKADTLHCENEKSNQNHFEQKSIVPNDIPENATKLIDKLETFNIFTETVAYDIKENRTESDKTIYCKNLFLKDRKGKFYYVMVREDSIVNLRQLKYKLKAHRNFSFASADEVVEQLKVEPGCITPFSFLCNSVSQHITVAISRELMFEKKLNFHPLHPDFATRISFGLLLKLFGHLGRKLHILDI